MYKTLIVVDNDNTLLAEKIPSVISFQTYLREYPKLNEPKTRIINLCDTEHYLSRGYYCSLLAEARHHGVLPNVKTINNLRSIGELLDDLMLLKSDLQALEKVTSAQTHMVYFGDTDNPEFKRLASRLFAQYPAPILRLVIDANRRISVEYCAFSALDDAQQQAFLLRLTHYTETTWRIGEKRKQHRWDMAILVNPEERVPPSDPEAIARFVKAASKQGINAQVVSAETLQQNLASFDALFIRETTAIDHHTYRLACRAEKLGLVVMDDPISILRCCNKVYLHDAFSYQKVSSLQTMVIDDSGEETVAAIEARFSYPMVLKMPEGSFSRGVFKVADRDALLAKLNELFLESALLLVQEYLYTEYDWRIGVLNGQAIFACRYLMARNHWQIYNHDKARIISGGFETVPTFEAPRVVLDTALKAAKIIGNGLYGVDIKEVNGKAYVLEVNDNPSLDYKVEDAYLGKELYMQIMGEFLRRLEARGR